MRKGLSVVAAVICLLTIFANTAFAEDKSLSSYPMLQTSNRNNYTIPGASSSWQTIYTVSKYWENTSAKEASYRSNMVAAPKADYRIGTIHIVNTATVKLKGDAKTYAISASC